jgi:hypothetical protein
MQQFVGDHEILKAWLLFGQVIGEGDNAGGGAGTPFSCHTLHANDPGLDLQTL